MSERLIIIIIITSPAVEQSLGGQEGNLHQGAAGGAAGRYFSLCAVVSQTQP